MATVNSSTSSSLSAKTGIGGLVSGMDIDELVTSLTQTSRNKITKQQQNIQKLQWKQTAYRSVTSDLKKFQSTYLDVLSTTNLRSKAFFNTVSATSSSDAVSVATTAAATAGTITVDSITQLATNQTVKSTDAVSKALTGKMGSAVAGTMDAADIDNLLAKISGKSINLNLDGKVKTVTFDSTFVSSVNANKTTAGLQSAFQAAIDTAYGVTKPENRVITVNASNDQLTFTAAGSKLTISNIGEDTTTLAALGFNSGQSNKINTSLSLNNLTLNTSLTGSTFKFKINTEEFEFNSTDTLSTIISRINSSKAGVTISYSSITDRFSMTANESGLGKNTEVTETSGNLMAALGLTGAGATVQDGQNAVLSVNNQTIVRSSNTFEVDGVKLTLNKAATTPVSITTVDDGTPLLGSIKKFVEDYNTMIDKINTLVREKVYSDYQPLTDEQKDEMSETQIEKWEEKAKSGLLRGDAILNGISSKLQTAIVGTSVNGTSLYTMGITTAGYTENGKLEIDETKLKEALKTKGNDIRELFTSTNGIGNKLNSIITGAVKTSGVQGSRGTLVEMAGVASTTSDTQNDITEKITRTNKNITSLKSNLTKEETRLWNRFTAMEKAIQQLNSQSSYLTQFTSGQ